jgi:hypothetical protein
MTRKIIYAATLILLLLSCKKENKSKVKQLEKEFAEQIDALAYRYLALNRFSGTIVLAKDYRIVYNQSFGLADYENEIPFTPNTAFKVGDITKLITSELITGLINEGKINKTDKVAQYLEELESDIKVVDFTKHNADIDYNIAGKLIEKISNSSYQENIDAYSKALGLENTYFQKEAAKHAVGYLYHNYRGKGLELEQSPVYNLNEAFCSKGLKSSAIDLVKILESCAKQINIHGYLADDGFSYSVINDLENKISIIVLSNRRHPVANEITKSINSILNHKEHRLPLLRVPFDIDKTILEDFTGKYALNEHMSFEVLTSNDSLFVLMGPNKVHLIPQSSNQFYMEEMDASMRFLRDSSNKVNEIVLLNGFIDSDEIAKRSE